MAKRIAKKAWQKAWERFFVLPAFLVPYFGDLSVKLLLNREGGQCIRCNIYIYYQVLHKFRIYCLHLPCLWSHSVCVLLCLCPCFKVGHALCACHRGGCSCIWIVHFCSKQIKGRANDHCSLERSLLSQ